MKTLSVTQGSTEWAAIRAQHNTASEAPIVMGASKYQTRADLLRQKATGLVPEADAHKQALFGRGHDAEHAALPLVEEMAGEGFSPVTGISDDGQFLASFDGITLMGDVIYEHKLWSESLAAQVRAGDLDPHYYWQLEQQLMVAEAEKVIFVTSDGTRDKFVSMEYRPVQGRREQLIAAWAQFAIDLAAYVPPEVIVPAMAAPQLALPAVSIQVNGSIALVDNLDKFGAALSAYVERINKKPETDQDFADLESTVKALKAAEEALEAAENGALAQTASIDTMRRTVALYRDTARTNRLLVEKLVKVEKENRRTKIIGDAAAELHSHVKALNERLGKPYMPTIAGDFLGVVKGLKSLDSMKDKVAGELARCKIEANAVADRIQANLATLRELASEHAFLFADTAQIVGKANDDLTALVKQRIAEHQAAEAAKEAATRERIRAEEQAKAEREVAEKLHAATPAPTLSDATTSAAITHDAVVDIMMPATVRQAMAPKPETPPTLRIGEIANRLGFGITAAFLRTIGFEPAGKEGASVLFHESDFPLICRALIEHIESVCELQAA